MILRREREEVKGRKKENVGEEGIQTGDLPRPTQILAQGLDGDSMYSPCSFKSAVASM